MRGAGVGLQFTLLHKGRGKPRVRGAGEGLLLGGKGHASWSKILEALDYYGLSYASKAVYPRGSAIPLPACCIVNNDNRFLLWYQGAFCGAVNVDPAKTVSCIEIFTE